VLFGPVGKIGTVAGKVAMKTVAKVGGEEVLKKTVGKVATTAIALPIE
jgi:hypothetical protein